MDQGAHFYQTAAHLLQPVSGEKSSASPTATSDIANELERAIEAYEQIEVRLNAFADRLTGAFPEEVRRTDTIAPQRFGGSLGTIGSLANRVANIVPRIEQIISRFERAS